MVDVEGFIFMIVGMTFTLVLLGVIFGFVRTEERRKAAVKLEIERERTMRALSDHVARGAIAPDDAIRMLHALDDEPGAAAEQKLRLSAPPVGGVAPIPAP